MSLAVLAFCGVFLLVASFGLRLFYREAMMQRIMSVVAPLPKKASISGKLRDAGSSISVVVESLGKVIPESQSEVSVVRQRLIRAGFRNDSAVKFFYGSKVVVIVLFCSIVAFTGLAANNPFIFYTASIGLDYIVPDFWLGRKIGSRQSWIRLSLPDLLDLLVICVEAGLGIDQATARATRELAPTHPLIADELDIVVLEQRAGRPSR